MNTKSSGLSFLKNNSSVQAEITSDKEDVCLNIIQDGRVVDHMRLREGHPILQKSEADICAYAVKIWQMPA